MTVYEYWQRRETGAVWAVKLTDDRVVGATQISRQDVHAELLPHLAYRTDDVDQLNNDRGSFKKIDGERAA
jgi:hypothetical protein